MIMIQWFHDGDDHDEDDKNNDDDNDNSNNGNNSDNGTIASERKKKHVKLNIRHCACWWPVPGTVLNLLALESLWV